jgi:hypothetical protein
MPSLSNSPRIRSAPHSRFSFAIALSQRYGLSGDLGCGRHGPGLVFPVEFEALAMPAEQRLWLDDKQGLFPGPHHSCQQNQEHPVRLGTGRSFHLSPENNELLTQECIFSHEFGLASGKVCQCPQHERSGVRFSPGDEAVVKQLKPNAYQPFNEGENPLHSVHSPLVKMSRCMLAIVLFLWGIGKEQETA